MGQKAKILKSGSPKTLNKNKIIQMAGELEKDRNILIRLNKRLAIKLYRADPEDEIFSDGTFVQSTVDIIKNEAAIVDEIIQRAFNEEQGGLDSGTARAAELNEKIDKENDPDKTKKVKDRLEFLDQHKWPEGGRTCGCGAELMTTFERKMFCPVAHPDLAKIIKRKIRSKEEKGEKVKSPNLKKDLKSTDVAKMGKED